MEKPAFVQIEVLDASGKKPSYVANVNLNSIVKFYSFQDFKYVVINGVPDRLGISDESFNRLTKSVFLINS